MVLIYRCREMQTHNECQSVKTAGVYGEFVFVIIGRSHRASLSGVTKMTIAAPTDLAAALHIWKGPLFLDEERYEYSSLFYYREEARQALG